MRRCASVNTKGGEGKGRERGREGKRDGEIFGERQDEHGKLYIAAIVAPAKSEVIWFTMDMRWKKRA